MTLFPCPGCQRHVRRTETRCPFCAQSVDFAARPEPMLPQRRLGRAATFAFSAGIVSITALAACGGEQEDGGSGGGTSTAGSSNATGGTSGAGTGGSVGSSGSTSAGGNGGTPDDIGGAVYGAPPVAGTSGMPDDGGNQPLYGAAP